LALRLAVTAPTDEKADLVLGHAEFLAARMSEDEVNRAKAADYESPASASTRRPHAKRFWYQPEMGATVVPWREECTIQPSPR